MENNSHTIVQLMIDLKLKIYVELREFNYNLKH
jgi:hypothetical protein